MDVLDYVTTPRQPIRHDDLLAELVAHLPPELLGKVRQRLEWAELRVLLLEEKLRLRRIAQYGPGSEKLSAVQLALLDDEPGVSADEVAAEGARPGLEGATPGRGQGRRGGGGRAHPGRQAFPERLPREERVVACTPEQAICRGCNGATVTIGYDESERLGVKPAAYFVAVTKREKRACPRCAEWGVAAAPLPPAIIEKGLATDAVVIDTLVAKYCDHVPLYRQSAALARDTGLDISRATLDGWVMRVGGLLEPLVGEMRRELLRGGYLQADETPVWVRQKTPKRKHHQAYLWQYGTPGMGAVFDFRLGREREGPRRWLGDWKGILQTDGYAAYEGVGGEGVVHAGCWSHARRKFIDALKLQPADREVIVVVDAINALFAIDRECRERQLDHAARLAQRQEHAPAILTELRRGVEALRAGALPGSARAQAAAYTLAQWPKLTHFLEHAELELSNNLAENSMRPVAVGRKNWIHIGSAAAGPRVAAIISVVESCRRLRLPLREYLAAVLPGLADQPKRDLARLTPAVWAAARA